MNTQTRLLIPLAALGLFGLSPRASAQNWSPAGGHITTRWAKDVTPYNPLPDYPRPQMVRERWQSLNGLWEFALTGKDDSAPPTAYQGSIAVPFPYESALSGLGRPSIPDQRLWCHKRFTVPKDWKGQRVLLHFGAVNWDSGVFVNGQSVGSHRGGYGSFTFDITDSLKPGGPNDLAVSAWNPLRANVPDAQAMGKQRLKPGGIFYTGATGIWQSVWMEPVPLAASVDNLKLTPNLDDNSLRVTVGTSGQGGKVKVVATDGGKTVGSVEGDPNTELRLAIPKAHLWTPEDPHLYDLAVTVLQDGKPADKVAGYFGMRKISLGQDDRGRTCLFLNNKAYFQRGVLDQGYWPDGIYTAPTDEALRYDLEITKKLGFNLDRKHAKVEPERWYYHCDKLGLLVWQDMPGMNAGDKKEPSDAAKRQFEAEWSEIIAQLRNHPSIVCWTIFNEGWGQYDTEQVVGLTRQYDSTRLVNEASGWTDKEGGDMHDTHAYPGPACESPESARAVVNGEYGGIGQRVEGHLWDPTGSWGYQGLARNGWSLTARYQELQRGVASLRAERGIGAVVYTQLTDVESESNGLVTYDRAVVKPIPEVVSAANQGKFIPLPPDPNPDPAPPSQEKPLAWKFTTDWPPGGWEQTGFDDGRWSTGQAPFGHIVKGMNTDWTSPDIWLRRRVVLPDKLPDKVEIIALYDEDPEIYINGVLAARAQGFVKDYVRLPISPAARAALKPGTGNVIAVHAHQTEGGQAIDVGIVAGN